MSTPLLLSLSVCCTQLLFACAPSPGLADATSATRINARGVAPNLSVGAILGEVPPEPSLPCFPGAIYRKLVSSHDVWTGIRGVVTLGVPVTDPSRIDAKTKMPLDNFSVYMGGQAGHQEIDAGLTWEVIKDSHGVVSPQRLAFRPFWRNNVWSNAPAEERYYWHPGDTVAMSVEWTGPGRLRLSIADADPSSGHRSFTTEFDALDFSAAAPRQFKRVNGIDQSHNEGKPVQPTRANIKGAVWLESSLRRGDISVPFSLQRATDMRCPAENVTIRATAQEFARGGEAVDLAGTAP